MLAETNLAEQIDVVAQSWADSPYYKDAERWTGLFWDQGTQFRTMFDRLDPTSMVELACGYGRHAEQAIELCESYVAMDVFQKNLDKTNARLQTHSGKLITHLADGRTFQPVPEQSVTGIYCYDTMVSFSPDIIRSYLVDAYRVLSPGGRVLLNHSNYEAPLDQHYRLNPHARNHMTYELFQLIASKAGLDIVESIVMTWGDQPDLDRLSLLEKPGG